MEKTRTPEDAARFWSDLEEEVVAWRRHFHQHPELSFQEFETAKYVENVLRAVGIEEVEAPTPTSRVAVIRGELPAGAGAFKTVAVRADMDALPVAEHEGGRKLPFCSVNPGVSHACGHDSHIAMLLGAAKALWRDRASFAGRVKLIFQHAEETAKSGAEELVALGVMDGVDACVGLHVMNQPMGTIAICRSRAATTAADSVWVDLEGCGTHASMPEGGVDPVMVGAEIISALHTIVSRTIAPSRFAVVFSGRRRRQRDSANGKARHQHSHQRAGRPHQDSPADDGARRRHCRCARRQGGA